MSADAVNDALIAAGLDGLNSVEIELLNEAVRIGHPPAIAAQSVRCSCPTRLPTYLDRYRPRCRSGLAAQVLRQVTQ